MSKIILVIGSVTADQIKFLRQSTNVKYIKPKFVRLQNDADLMAIEDRYYEDSLEYMGDDPSVEVIQDNPWGYIQGTFYALTGHPMSDILGYIVDEPTWLNDENFFINRYPVLNTGISGPLLDVDIRYVAYPDGRVEVL